MQIGSLFVKIGFTADNDKLMKVNSSITAISTSFLALESLIEDAYNSMQKFLQSTMDMATSLERVHTAWGLNPQEMQKWEYGAMLTGVGASAEEAGSSIVNVQKHLSELQMSLGNVMGYNFLGVSGLQAKDAFGLMDAVSDRMRQMGKIPDEVRGRLSTSLGMMGINPEVFYKLLEMNKAQRNNLVKGLILSDSDLNRIDKMNISLNKFQLVMDKLKNSLVTKFAPTIGNDFEKFSNYLLKHQNDILKFFDDLNKKIKDIGRSSTAKGFIDLRNHILKVVKSLEDVWSALIKMGAGNEILRDLNTSFKFLNVLLDITAKSLEMIANDIDNISGKNLFGGKTFNQQTKTGHEIIDNMLDKIDNFVNKVPNNSNGVFIDSLSHNLSHKQIKEPTVIINVPERVVKKDAEHHLRMKTPFDISKQVTNYFTTHQKVDIRSDNMKDAGAELKKATYDAYYQHAAGDR